MILKHGRLLQVFKIAKKYITSKLKRIKVNKTKTQPRNK